MSEQDKHTISVLVENQSGVLARIAGLFSGRGFNIASLSVGETVDPDVSRMTIVVDADAHTLEQVTKQLQKLVVTIKVDDFADRSIVSSELAMIKINARPSQRSEIMDLIDIFDSKIVDIDNSEMTIQFVGSEREIEDVIDLLDPYGIQEIARTGSVALARSSN